MSQNDFLVEILTEELPPKSLRLLAEKFLEEIINRLTKAELTFAHPKFFATPRRLAVYIENLSEKQSDKNIERKGPAIDKAFDANGNPTQACLGFAKSAGVDISALTKADNFVWCKQLIKGKTVFELMPQIVSEALSALPIPKPMRWGNHQEKFIRPVHAVILLYGDKVIDAEILGIKTGNKTRGHRFHNPEWITIKNPAAYEKQLLDKKVIADPIAREHKITSQIDALIEQKSLESRSAMQVLNEVVNLVEWPIALLGTFDENFLALPPEIPIISMQVHQRYFPCGKKGKLTNHFIIISNIESTDPKQVIAGNERVLRARLSDAAFFYETDKKIKLIDRVEKLKHIIFQNKLGTLFDKTERVKKLSIFIASQIGANKQITETAAQLAKTDLTTELVGEFPELQGIIGYELYKNENAEIATILKDYYLPRFSGDNIPTTKESIALAIADRIDTLVGIFGINQAPTGDKDPFALRRAALGILRILIENKIHLDLKKLIETAASHFTTLENKNVITDTLSFILERIRSYYSGAPATVIHSVLALHPSDPYDMIERIDAVIAFSKLPEAESLASANKRVSNILAKNTDAIVEQTIQENLFESDSEKTLVALLQKQEKIIATLNNYTEILSQLASLKAPIDNFFDNVMVMTEDKNKRENRLLILKKLRDLFLHVADIALLQ